MRPDTPHWSFDDNTRSMELGFIIAESPSVRGKLELVGTDRYSRMPQKELIATVVRMSSIDPLCAKAVRALTLQKLTGESKL